MAHSRALFFLLIVTAAVAVSAQKYSPDHQAIRNNEFDLEKAWNSHDMKALAARVAEDVQLVTSTGEMVYGRPAFEDRYTALHAVRFKNSKYSTSDDDIDVAFLSNDIAIAHVRWSMTGERAADGSARPPGKGIATKVYVKKDGNWLIRASHITLVPEQQKADPVKK